MEEVLLQVPATISKVTTMGNGAIRLQVDTQEDVNPVTQVKIFTYYNKLGVFAFSKSNINAEELIIPDIAPNPEEPKSKAQRLRAVFFRMWEQNGKKDMYGNECGSDMYYDQMMEKLIEHYKQKLE